MNHSSHCHASAICDKENGTCPPLDESVSGCAAGWTGQDCQSECQAGLFGFDCLQECGNCRFNEDCNVVCLRIRTCLSASHIFFIIQHTGVCPNGCERSWTGDFCTEGMLCNPNPCRNSGRCEQLNADTFQCHCVDPFEGNLCQLGGCKTRPCLNWGQCSDLFEPNELGLGKYFI